MQDQDRIRQRAHDLWEKEGRPEGRHAEHWTQAEQELRSEGNPSAALGATTPETADPEQVRLNPGDDAAPGTPGTGEDVCPVCQGSGRVADGSCGNCGGTGKVIKGIAGG